MMLYMLIGVGLGLAVSLFYNWRQSAHVGMLKSGVESSNLRQIRRLDGRLDEVVSDIELRLADLRKVTADSIQKMTKEPDEDEEKSEDH